MAKNTSFAQILETKRGELEMTKGEFAEALGVSRQWYDQILNGRQFDLKTLCYLSVDYSGEWQGKLANTLIETIYGKAYIPIGEQTELMNFREYLRKINYNDLSGMAPALANGHFPLWASELQTRHDQQLAEAKAQIIKDREVQA